MEIIEKSNGTADNMQNVEIGAEKYKQNLVMDYDTNGLVVGSKKRKQAKESAENKSVEFHKSEIGVFKFKYSLLKPILDYASRLKQDFIQLQFQDAGMHVQFVNQSNIAMGIFSITKEDFMQY